MAILLTMAGITLVLLDRQEVLEILVPEVWVLLAAQATLAVSAERVEGAHFMSMAPMTYG